MKFIITGDALYPTTPMIDICNEHKWYYIFNLKQDKFKQVYEELEDNIAYKNKTTKSNCFLSTNISFKGNKFKAFRYMNIEDDKIITFNYISNLNANNHNIEKIVSMGRAHLKIENEGFNVQKNGTVCISHLCSRNENALKVHYYLIQIAHILRQLLEQGSTILREMKLQTKKRSKLTNDQ